MIDETELKEEVEVKEEPEELPEPSEPEQTPKEQPKALTKQQIELQEALLLMEQEDYSEGSDVEDYYWWSYLTKEKPSTSRIPFFDGIFVSLLLFSWAIKSSENAISLFKVIIFNNFVLDLTSFYSRLE